MTGSPDRLVAVGVDGSEPSSVAVRFAALEAVRLGADALDVVTVVPGYLPTGPLPMIPDGALQSYAHEALELATGLAGDTAPDLKVRTHLLHGRRVAELSSFSEQAQLLVLGGRHASVVHRVWTGSTVTGVSARARCPVVVVPPTWEAGTRTGRVVVAVKAPEHSAALLDEAFAVADELGAELLVLHAWRLPGGYDDIISSRVKVEEWQTDESSAVEPFLAPHRQAHPTVVAHVEVVHARPAHALLEASRHADRLLIARPAHGGQVHHLGSTARALLREAHCPVEVLAASTEGADAGVARWSGDRPLS